MLVKPRWRIDFFTAICIFANIDPHRTDLSNVVMPSRDG